MDPNLIYTIVGAVIGIIATTIGAIFTYYFSLNIRKKDIKRHLIQKMKYVLSDFKYNILQCYICNVNKYSIDVPPLDPREQIELRKSLLKELRSISSDLYSLNITKDFGKKIEDIENDAFKLIELLYNDTSGWTKVVPPNDKTDKKYQYLMKKIDNLLNQTIE